MKRKIVNINEALCNGCGNCIPKCAEGALQIVNGKAKIIKETYCDGLGACLGQCPQGAITITEREAEAFNESEVQEHLKNKTSALPSSNKYYPTKASVANKTQPRSCKSTVLRKRRPPADSRLRTSCAKRLPNHISAGKTRYYRLPQIRRCKSLCPETN